MEKGIGWRGCVFVCGTSGLLVHGLLCRRFTRMSDACSADSVVFCGLVTIFNTVFFITAFPSELSFQVFLNFFFVFVMNFFFFFFFFIFFCFCFIYVH